MKPYFSSLISIYTINNIEVEVKVIFDNVVMPTQYLNSFIYGDGILACLILRRGNDEMRRQNRTSRWLFNQMFKQTEIVHTQNRQVRYIMFQECGKWPALFNWPVRALLKMPNLNIAPSNYPRYLPNLVYMTAFSITITINYIPKGTIILHPHGTYYIVGPGRRYMSCPVTILLILHIQHKSIE